MASASAAPTNRPVKISSLARLGPISRVSRWVPPAPGMMPSLISGWPSIASSAAIRMSAHSASSQPPPSAYPLIAATTGLRIRATAAKCPAARRECAHHVGVRQACHLLDVGPGGENLLAAGQHDGGDVVAAVALAGRLGDAAPGSRRSARSSSGDPAGSHRPRRTTSDPHSRISAHGRDSTAGGRCPLVFLLTCQTGVFAPVACPGLSDCRQRPGQNGATAPPGGVTHIN